MSPSLVNDARRSGDARGCDQLAVRTDGARFWPPHREGVRDRCGREVPYPTHLPGPSVPRAQAAIRVDTRVGTGPRPASSPCRPPSRVPEPGSSVAAGGGVPVGAEGGGVDRIRLVVAAELRDEAARRRPPDPHVATLRRGDDRRAVRAERRGPDELSVVGLQNAHRAAVRPPEACSAVSPGGDDESAVGAELGVEDRSGVPLKGGKEPARACTPDPADPVVAGSETMRPSGLKDGLDRSRHHAGGAGGSFRAREVPEAGLPSRSPSAPACRRG